MSAAARPATPDPSESPVQPFACIPHAILWDARLSPVARLTAAAMVWFARGNREACRPSNEALAAKLGLSVPSVKAALRQLEACGHIRRKAVEQTAANPTGRLIVLRWRDDRRDDPFYCQPTASGEAEAQAAEDAVTIPRTSAETPAQRGGGGSPANRGGGRPLPGGGSPANRGGGRPPTPNKNRSLRTLKNPSGRSLLEGDCSQGTTTTQAIGNLRVDPLQTAYLAPATPFPKLALLEPVPPTPQAAAHPTAVAAKRPRPHGKGQEQQLAELRARADGGKTSASAAIPPEAKPLATAVDTIRDWAAQARSLQGEPNFYGGDPTPESHVGESDRPGLARLRALVEAHPHDRILRGELERAQAPPAFRPAPHPGATTAELIAALPWCDATIVPRTAEWLARDFADPKYWSGFNAECDAVWRYGRQQPWRVDRLLYAYGKAMGPTAKHRGRMFKHTLNRWDDEHLDAISGRIVAVAAGAS